MAFKSPYLHVLLRVRDWSRNHVLVSTPVIDPRQRITWIYISACARKELLSLNY